MNGDANIQPISIYLNGLVMCLVDTCPPRADVNKWLFLYLFSADALLDFPKIKKKSWFGYACDYLLTMG